MKTILCIGRIIKGGAIELVAPTNAEEAAMDADLAAILNGKPLGYRLTAEQLEEIENEAIGREIGQHPWEW